MNKFTIAINGKQQKVIASSNWGEVNLGQMLAFESVDMDDPCAVFSVLSGVRVDEASPAFMDEILDAVEFVYTTPEWDKLKAPSHLVIDGKPYKLPNIAKETLGQTIMVTQMIARSKDIMQVIPKALAIWFQPFIDGGQFDRKRLDAVEAMILRCPCIEAYGTAAFFLKKRSVLKIFGQVGSHLFQPPRQSPSAISTRGLESSSGSTTSSRPIPPTHMMMSFILSLTLL